MKNHWIKKKEDREKEKFRGKFQEALPAPCGRMYSDNIFKEVLAEEDKKFVKVVNADLKKEWNHVAIQFDGTVSEIYVNGEALSAEEVKERYEFYK